MLDAIALTMGLGPTLVPCFPLTTPGLLTPEQMEAVRPFLRETFSDMAEVFWNGGGTNAAVNALCDAAGTNGWDRIEAALYAKARALGTPPVMARKRVAK